MWFFLFREADKDRSGEMNTVREGKRYRER